VPKPYSIDKQDNDPLIILRIAETFQLDPDLFDFSRDILELLDIVETPHYLLLSLGSKHVDLDGLLLGATYTTREGKPYLYHENMRLMLLVTPDTLWKNTKYTIVSSVSGAARIRLFESDDEAREYLLGRGITYPG